MQPFGHLVWGEKTMALLRRGTAVHCMCTYIEPLRLLFVSVIALFVLARLLLRFIETLISMLIIVRGCKRLLRQQQAPTLFDFRRPRITRSVLLNHPTVHRLFVVHIREHLVLFYLTIPCIQKDFPTIQYSAGKLRGSCYQQQAITSRT